MSLAIGSNSLIRKTEKISYYIDNVYEEMKEFTRMYQYFVQIYNDNANMSLEEFRHRD